MLVKYSVKYINDNYQHNDHEDEPASYDDEGIVSATDYNECVARLNERYGEECIFWFSFCPLMDVITKSEMDDVWD